MNLNKSIEVNKSSLILKGYEDDFILDDIFLCGQCFRWERSSESKYIGVISKYLVEVSQYDDFIEIKGINDFNSDYFIEYFDLQTDYSDIKNILIEKDGKLRDIIATCSGIRLLNQEVYETILTFIISANNNIPKIKLAIEDLSNNFGEFICSYGGKDYYRFPEAEVIANESIENLHVKGIGFRDKYIKRTSEMIVSNQLDLEKLKLESREDAKIELLKFYGVGSKVSDCILLFSLKKRNSFPIDTWMKKIMSDIYGIEDVDEMHKFAEKQFGELSGFAQQYLFYYAMERKK